MMPEPLPPYPPLMCPGCGRDECLLWKQERLRQLSQRRLAQALRFGFQWGTSKCFTFMDYARDLQPAKEPK